jgi:hypothetical protein
MRLILLVLLLALLLGALGFAVHVLWLLPPSPRGVADRIRLRSRARCRLAPRDVSSG